MKIERIFDNSSEKTLEDILQSLIKSVIDIKINNLSREDDEKENGGISAC